MEHKVAWAEAYLHTKWRLSPSSRLGTTNIGRKFGGGCAPLGEGELGPQLTQIRLVEDSQTDRQTDRQTD